MLIILPNLKHSFISPVPVPVPDPDFLVFHTPLRSQIDIFNCAAAGVRGSSFARCFFFFLVLSVS